MPTPARIEQQFNFTYPELFKEIYVEGKLDWGLPDANWFQNVYPTLKTNPPFLLYAKDFELLNFDEVIQELQLLNNPDDYRKVNPIFKFIPFGSNGAGDFYCFYYSRDFPASIPIVLATHDSLQLHLLAKNLEDFLFAQMLEAVTDLSSDSLILDGDYRENIRNFHHTHHTYLNGRQQNIIVEIYRRELTSISYPIDCSNGKSQTKVETGLLTTAELLDILNQEIAFEQLHKTYNYTLPVPIEAITENNKKHVGVLILKICPIPQKHDKLHEALKTLNWRKRIPNEPTTIEYYRQGSVLFGIPSITTMDDTFRQKLIDLKDSYLNIEIYFEEEGTRYKL